MFNGAHFLIFSENAEADRAFFRDVLGLGNVDAGDNWLIFALPPAEIAIHPTDSAQQVNGLAVAMLYLMCEDVRATIEQLQARGVICSAVNELAWGITTTIRLPSGSEIGLYQPKHPTAFKAL